MERWRCGQRREDEHGDDQRDQRSTLPTAGRAGQGRLGQRRARDVIDRRREARGGEKGEGLEQRHQQRGVQGVADSPMLREQQTPGAVVLQHLVVIGGEDADQGQGRDGDPADGDQREARSIPREARGRAQTP
ncbi:MAG: hypothetical protein CSB49_06080 [Proteobacteria bacterium]|nr:MAG: hypothetical protein CSB49_06080 [Pseudomonadota bacterium]